MKIVKFIKICNLKSNISVVLIFHLYFCFQSGCQETTSIYLFCSDKNNICCNFKLKMLIWNICQNTLQVNIDYLRTKNPKSRKHKEKVKYYKKPKHVNISSMGSALILSTIVFRKHAENRLKLLIVQYSVCKVARYFVLSQRSCTKLSFLTEPAPNHFVAKMHMTI